MSGRPNWPVRAWGRHKPGEYHAGADWNPGTDGATGQPARIEEMTMTTAERVAAVCAIHGQLVEALPLRRLREAHTWTARRSVVLALLSVLYQVEHGRPPTAEQLRDIEELHYRNVAAGEC